MENGVVPVTGDFGTEEEVYSKVIQENVNISHDLPAWKNQPAFMDEFWAKIKEWLASILPEFTKSERVDINWEQIFSALFFLLMIFGALIIAFLIYKYIQSRSKSELLDFKLAPLLVETREQRLQLMIQNVMKEGRWSDAARLRWRLYLERKGLSMQLTPLEYQNIAKHDLPDAIEQYQHMFAQTSDSKEWFDLYNKKLKTLESQI